MLIDNHMRNIYVLALTGIDLKYDETLAVSEVRQEQRPNDNQVYDLQGRIVGSIGQLDALPKGVYIVNGKKRVVR